MRPLRPRPPTFEPPRNGLRGWYSTHPNNFVMAAEQAASFAAASSESLSIDDNASLSTGDVDFSFCAWVYLTDTSTVRVMAAKVATTLVREWALLYSNANDRFNFVVYDSGGAAAGTVVATSLGAPATSTWYFVACWHDSVANTVHVQVNDGTVDSAATTGVPANTAAGFSLGAWSTPLATFWQGRISASGFWKKVLSSAERTQLYNAGTPLLYHDLTDGLKTSLESYWELTEGGGNRRDFHGANHLTDNNTVLSAAGIGARAVSQWTDRSGKGNHATQATAANQPTLRRTGLWFDTVGSHLVVDSLASIFAGEDPAQTVISAFKPVQYQTVWAQQILGISNGAASTDYAAGSGLLASTQYAPAIRRNDAAANVATISFGQGVSAAWHVVSAVSKGATASLFVDGFAVGGGEDQAFTNAGALPLSLAAIGVMPQRGPAPMNEFFDGYLGEILVYDRALHRAERRAIERYLGVKYGTALR